MVLTGTVIVCVFAQNKLCIVPVSGKPAAFSVSRLKPKPRDSIIRWSEGYGSESGKRDLCYQREADW